MSTPQTYDPLFVFKLRGYADYFRAGKFRKMGFCRQILNTAPHRSDAETLRQGYAEYLDYTPVTGMEITKFVPIQKPTEQNMCFQFADTTGASDKSGQQVWVSPYWNHNGTIQTGNLQVGESKSFTGAAGTNPTTYLRVIIFTGSDALGLSTVADYYKDWLCNNTTRTKKAIVTAYTYSSAAGGTSTFTFLEQIGSNGLGFTVTDSYVFYRHFHANLGFLPKYNNDRTNPPVLKADDTSTMRWSGGQGSNTGLRGVRAQYINRTFFPNSIDLSIAQNPSSFSYVGLYVSEQECKSTSAFTYSALSIYASGFNSTPFPAATTIRIGVSPIYDGFQHGTITELFTEYTGSNVYNAIQFNGKVFQGLLDKRITGFNLWYCVETGNTGSNPRTGMWLFFQRISITDSAVTTWTFSNSDVSPCTTSFYSTVAPIFFLGNNINSASITWVEATGIEEIPVDTMYSYSDEETVAGRRVLNNVYVASESAVDRQRLFTNPIGALYDTIQPDVFSNEQDIYRLNVAPTTGSRITSIRSVGIGEVFLTKDRGLLRGRPFVDSLNTLQIEWETMSHVAGCAGIAAITRSDDGWYYFCGYDDIYRYRAGGEYERTIERPDQQDWLYIYRELVSKTEKESTTIWYLPQGVVKIDFGDRQVSFYPQRNNENENGWRQDRYSVTQAIDGVDTTVDALFRWVSYLTDGTPLTIVVDADGITRKLARWQNTALATPIFFFDDGLPIYYRFDTGSIEFTPKDLVLDALVINRTTDLTEGIFDVTVYRNREELQWKKFYNITKTDKRIILPVNSDDSKLMNAIRLIVNTNDTPERLINDTTQLQFNDIEIYGELRHRLTLSGVEQQIEFTDVVSTLGSGDTQVNPPPPPVGTPPTPFFRVASKTSTTVTLEWGDFTGRVGQFHITRVGDLNSDSATITSPRSAGSFGSATLQMTDAELLIGSQYDYTLLVTFTDGNPDLTLTCSAITNPLGAYCPTLKSPASLATGASITSDPFQHTSPLTTSFYGGSFNHVKFTVEFWFKNLGNDVGTIWRRKGFETIFGGGYDEISEIGVNNGFFTFQHSRYFVDSSEQIFPVQFPSIAVPIGESHHWAWTYDLNNTSIPHHTIKIYRDGILVDTLTSNNGSVSPSGYPYNFTPDSTYQRQTTFEMMRSVNGVLDELRVWNYTRSAAEILAFYPEVVRESPSLLYRFGFDNYSLQSLNQYPSEFTSFGQYVLDPAHNATFQSNGLVAFQYDDTGGSTYINRYITEPLGVQISPVMIAPVLVSPANAAASDTLTPTFAWNGVLGALTYDLDIALDSGFTSIIYSTTGIAATTKVLNSGILSVNNTYYWRVRAVNAIQTTNWATAFNFTTPVYTSVFRVNIPSQTNAGTTTLVEETSAKTVVMNNMTGAVWNADLISMDFNGTNQYVTVDDTQFRGAEMVGNSNSNNRNFSTTVGNWTKTNTNDTLTSASGGVSGNGLKLVIGASASSTLLTLSTDVTALVIGQSYHMELSVCYETSWNGRLLTVTCGGVSQHIQLTTSFQTMWYDFVAQSTTPTITISSGTAPSNGNVLRIDNVTLTPSSKLNMSSGEMIFDPRNRSFDQCIFDITDHGDWTVVGANHTLTGVNDGTMTLQTPTTAGNQTTQYVSLPASKFMTLVQGKKYTLQKRGRSSGGSHPLNFGFGASGQTVQLAQTSGGYGLGAWTFTAGANDVGQDLRMWLTTITGGGNTSSLFGEWSITEALENSIAIWFKKTIDTGITGVIANCAMENTGTAQLYLAVLDPTTNNIESFSRDVGDTSTFVDGGSNVIDGIYHHLVGSWSRTDGIRIFVNGSQVGTVANTGLAKLWAGITGKLVICAYSTPSISNYYKGAIGRVEFFNGLIPSSEALSIYNAQKSTYGL